MKYTTYSGLQVILRALSHYGLDEAVLSNEYGIPIPETSDVGQHISPSVIERILEVAISEAGDPAFTLRIAEHIAPSTFGEFSIGLFTSHNLLNLLERAAKYYPYISTTQRLRVVRINDQAILLSHFSEKSIKEEIRQLWTEVAFAFIFRFMRLMGQPDFKPTRIELKRSIPASAEQRYTEFFGITPKFGAARNAISFSIDSLEAPLTSGGMDISEEYEKRIISRIAEIDQTNLPLRVHAYIVEELPRRVLSKEVVARHFAMSVKTLQNRLADSGTSYQQLLDHARHELSELYLSFPEVTLAQIADMLGYSDASNFCRAYKRWTGEVPRAKTRPKAEEELS